jgi:hypothetical protein
MLAVPSGVALASRVTNRASELADARTETAWRTDAHWATPAELVSRTGDGTFNAGSGDAGRTSGSSAAYEDGVERDEARSAITTAVLAARPRATAPTSLLCRVFANLGHPEYFGFVLAFRLGRATTKCVEATIPRTSDMGFPWSKAAAAGISPARKRIQAA